MCKKSNTPIKAKAANDIKFKGFRGNFCGSQSTELDNKETFVQFRLNLDNRNVSKSSFLLSNYRASNLDIVKALKNSKFGNNEHIKKICKGLNCCSSLSLIEENDDGGAHIRKTSNKCRRGICPICNRIRTAKYLNRFVSAYNCPQNKALFKNKRFFHITFTLKHNNTDTRKGVYLKELKGYIKALKRSKVWKKFFPYSKKNPLSGWAFAYETTTGGDNGLHIHSHCLMCCPRLKFSYNTVQNEIREKWQKITKDSFNVCFDAIQMCKTSEYCMNKNKIDSPFMRGVLEVFKYSIKIGSRKKLMKNADALAEYLIETKGKNMINAGGFFRGLGLFSLKSIWDTDAPTKKEYDKNARFYVGRTSNIVFNHNVKKYLSKENRARILETAYLKGIYINTADNVRKEILYAQSYGDYQYMPTSFIEITNCVRAFDKYFSMSVFDADFALLPDWVEYAKSKTITANRATDSNAPPPPLDNETQLNLFNDS